MKYRLLCWFYKSRAATGAAGATGEAGAKGDIGPTGPAGATGAKGDIGPTGPASSSEPVNASNITGTILIANPADANTTGQPTPIISTSSISFKTTTPNWIKMDVSTDTLASKPAAMVTINTSDALSTAITNLQTSVTNLNVTANYSTTETATGQLFNGKPIFRRLFNTSVTTNRTGDQSDIDLISTQNYVDTIVNAGGNFNTGNGNEKFMISAAYQSDNSIYGFVYVSTDNKLSFRSRSSQPRSNTPVSVWVDYTKY